MASVDCDACAYPQCGFGPVTENVGKVEVRAYQTPPECHHLLRLKWGSKGQAMFHRQCWTKVMQMLGKPREGEVPPLSYIEKRMLTEAKKTAEFHDSDEQLHRAADHIVRLLQNSSHAIAFTGAGISTAAGIGDFRGKDGHWTNRDKDKEYGKQPRSRGLSVADIRPTYSHEALVKLHELNLIKFVISQNVDGLHRLSGISSEKLSELHGNTFMEKCENCNQVYERKRPVGSRSSAVPPKRCKDCTINHRTGAICSDKTCNGYLMKTVINFGDSLIPDDIHRATYHSRQSDLVLCLGSTLMVSPANEFVTMGRKPLRLIICNRQTTPFDDLCDLTGRDGASLGSRVFADCDRLIKMIMGRLLPGADLKQWEAEKPKRMEKYNRLRDE